MEFKRVDPTDDQWQILNKATELLEQFDKEEQTISLCYFTDKAGEGFGSDYDCCGDSKCVEEAKKMIRLERGNRIIIEENYTYTLCDYERFESCCVCGAHFNEFLTWISDEFDHHEQYSLTENDFRNSQTAYELRGIYNSLHWHCDNEISGYDRHQYFQGNTSPLNNTLKRQQELVNRVVKHASLVIKALGKEETE